MGIIGVALLTGALLVNSKPKKKRRNSQRKRYTRKHIIARRKQSEREHQKLTQKALEDFAKALND